MLPSIRAVAGPVAHHLRTSAHGLRTMTSSSTASLLSPSHTITPPVMSFAQRRMSSSKPSDAGDDPKISDVHTTTSSSPSESSKRKRRPRSSNSATEMFKHLPSVPSTQHLSQEALGLSTFFSLHRPISVTTSLPRTTSPEAFASIFSAKTRAYNASDVISTLSKYVEELDQPEAKVGLSRPDEREGEVLRKLPNGSISLQLSSMSGQYLPFQPPPRPEPVSEEESSSAASMTNAAQGNEAELQETHHRVYEATFTIEETMDQGGQLNIVAHSPRFRHPDRQDQDHGLSLLRQRSVHRLSRYQQLLQRREELYAISVKRQRKLKMKKKKYKKLMRRTRNERRKLDRL